VFSDVTVVLAHGAWADGSSWSKVIDALEADGVRAVAAALPLTSFQEDVAALDRTLERISGPVVLAGHAYAGGVIGATHAGNVKALVYVAALVPDEGETVADVLGRVAPHPQAPAVAPDANGYLWLPDDAFPNAFAQDASTQEHTLLRGVQRPISISAITVPVGRPLWKTVPSWFLLAEQDRMIPAENQHFMADRIGADVRVHPVDHVPLITAPGVVVDLLLEVVEKVRKESTGA
jgi:pimeloyl-ACP methyl ester carboxylesterase